MIAQGNELRPFLSGPEVVDYPAIDGPSNLWTAVSQLLGSCEV